MAEDRIVAIGLLTQRDLDVLGSGFQRMFAVGDDDIFSDLLDKLDAIEVEVRDEGISIKPRLDQR